MSEINTFSSLGECSRCRVALRPASSELYAEEGNEASSKRINVSMMISYTVAQHTIRNKGLWICEHRVKRFLIPNIILKNAFAHFQHASDHQFGHCSSKAHIYSQLNDTRKFKLPDWHRKCYFIC
jgi:hypothetical protein